jgi:hypothetical protein
VSKREDKRTTYRVETFSFVRKKKGSFLFVGTLDQKKIFDDESREFSEILSEGALLLSFSLHCNILRATFFTTTFTTTTTREPLPSRFL